MTLYVLFITIYFSSIVILPSLTHLYSPVEKHLSIQLKDHSFKSTFFRQSFILLSFCPKLASCPETAKFKIHQFSFLGYDKLHFYKKIE